MFELIFDLPVHILILHATVVLVPIGALATVAVTLRPAWRAHFGALVALANVSLLALTFVTVQSGYKLEEAMGGRVLEGSNHEKYGEITMWVYLAFAVLSVIAWGGTRMPKVPPAAVTALGVGMTVLAFVAIGYTIATGHTGAEVQWGYLSE